ncbi:MAG: putative toxin-antitoxin system toxin component, PIN family [Actinobacteria bacterium]|nr:putative toxin-antitoxin system toxin component, PIN family [Actinomycetota bacterium]
MINRVVIDTNVLISGILFGGIPEKVLNHARKGTFTSIISLYILSEFKRVMKQKLNLNSDLINNFIKEIISFSEIIPVIDSKKIWIQDISDNPIVETAVKGKANIIVTGDKRLHKVKVHGLKILSPKDFLGML